MNPLPCYRCGKVPEVDPNDGYPVVSCSDCYDGAPDSGSRSELGSGLTRAEAVGNWNERMRELADDAEWDRAHPEVSRG